MLRDNSAEGKEITLGGSRKAGDAISLRVKPSPQHGGPSGLRVRDTTLSEERDHRLQTLNSDAGFAFTHSEARIVALLERGLTNREIASVLGISANTVRNRVASAFQRAGASTRAELVYLLRERS